MVIWPGHARVYGVQPRDLLDGSRDDIALQLHSLQHWSVLHWAGRQRLCAVRCRRLVVGARVHRVLNLPCWIVRILAGRAVIISMRELRGWAVLIWSGREQLFGLRWRNVVIILWRFKLRIVCRGQVFYNSKQYCV